MANAAVRGGWGVALIALLVGVAGSLVYFRRSGEREAEGAARGPSAAGQERALLTPSPGGAAGAAAGGRPGRVRMDPEARERARRSADATRARIRAARERAALARAAAPARPEAPARPSMPSLDGTGNQANKPLGQYIRDIVREQFFPMGRDCYEELLGRAPRASGKMVLNVVVAGERELGGVVESVDLGPGSTLVDEAFATCVRESMYAVEFDAPPDGHEQIDFTYPIIFEPDGPDAGSAG